MDLSVLLRRRLAVGGGIWTAANMAALAQRGFTHIVNVQAEFDDSALAAAAGLKAQWCPIEDNMLAMPPSFFEPGVGFALAALRQPGNCVYVHCAAGVHRGPLMAAAILCGMGRGVDAAVALVARRRVWAEFPEIYLDSLRAWLAQRVPAPVRPR
ncbi:MAG: dual specificity protein phosphatase family protein [Terriglobales bacterium]